MILLGIQSWTILGPKNGRRESSRWKFSLLQLLELSLCSDFSAKTIKPHILPPPSSLRINYLPILVKNGDKCQIRLLNHKNISTDIYRP